MIKGKQVLSKVVDQNTKLQNDELHNGELQDEELHNTELLSKREYNLLRTKLYRKRWYIIFVYVLYMMCNSSQWLQYSIIANVVKKYYGITVWHVNLTSLVMMGCYLPLALPAASLMDKISLRWTAILGSTGTAVGSVIKLFSASPGGFPITLAGQTVVAVSQVLMLSVPQKLSSVWFGEKEVSSACSIGVFGFQFGLVIGFFLPPMLVTNHDNIDDIGKDMFWMFLYFAVASCVCSLVVILTFQAEPLLPPSISQVRLRSQNTADKEKYVTTLKRLFTKRQLVTFFITTGVNNGCFNGLSTLLSQIFLDYFPGYDEDAGRIGVTMIILGMTASVTYGYILDRMKKFKLTLMTIYYMSAVAMAAFTLLLEYIKTLWIIYVAAAFVGTFLCGFTAVSFDVATEITYPESELIVGTIMNMMSLVFTFATTLLFGYINETFGYLWGNVGFVVTLVLGATCTLPITFEHRRSEAQKRNLTERKQLL